MDKRFFYHSFPRRHPADLDAGLTILESMLESGLLLTPEVIAWREPNAPANQTPTFTALQIRCCFTELSETELFDHSMKFGCFALEFSAEAIRELGAIPVFYVPNCPGAMRGFNGAAQALVMRLAQIQELVNRVLYLRDHNQEPQAVNFISQGLVSLQELGFSAIALQSLLYPAENLTYTDQLGYYRQREWRIIENFAIGNVWPFRELSPSEKQRLSAFDPDLFQRELKHPPSGNGRVIDRCRFFSELEGVPVMNRVRRIIVPRRMLRKATALVKSRQLNVPVTTIRKFWIRRLIALFSK